MHRAAWMSIAAGGVAGMCAPAAPARLSQVSVSPPGGFLQAASYLASGGGGSEPGADLEAVYGPAEDMHQSLFPGNGSTSQAASFSDGSVTNGAQATVGMGSIVMSAHNTFPNNAQFAGAFANGGWKDSFQVDHPAFDGQGGFMLFHVRVVGTISAEEFAGSVRINVAPYKNNIEMLKNAYYDGGDSDPIGTSFQKPQWGVSTNAVGEFEARTIDDTVTMSVPITFGEPFTLGVYGLGRAGQRSASGVPGLSHDELECAIWWGGIVDVIVEDAPIGGYTITTGSGVDWSGEVTPPQCPADLDGSGAVNSADLNMILASFGCSGGGCAGDIDGDGDTDSADLNGLLADFGEACP